MPKDGELDFEYNSKKPACLRPGCTRDTYGGSRGLCMSHYAVLQAKIKRGAITWEQLEAEGRAKPLLTFQERDALRMERNLKRVWSKNLGRFIFVKIK
jgi:hypothetical protein